MFCNLIPRDVFCQELLFLRLERIVDRVIVNSVCRGIDEDMEPRVISMS